MPNEASGQGVLNEQHFNNIIEGLAKLDEAERQIKLARAAGMNMDAQQKQVDDTRAQLRQVKAVYFPGR